VTAINVALDARWPVTFRCGAEIWPLFGSARRDASINRWMWSTGRDRGQALEIPRGPNCTFPNYARSMPYPSQLPLRGAAPGWP